MSIDADELGVITEAEALAKRERIQKDADFYGSMDGASKFVRGDVAAGIFITVVNIIGGILIGYFQKDMTITGSLENTPSYRLRRIGEPDSAIIISIAAGILVTCSSEEANLGEFVGRQLTIYPRATASQNAFVICIFSSETSWPFYTFYCLLLLTTNRISDSDESSIEEIGETASGTGLTPSKMLGILHLLRCPMMVSRSLNCLPWKVLLNRKFLVWKWATVYLFWPTRRKVAIYLIE